MSSYSLGTLSIDPTQVDVDLRGIENFGYVDSYDEFVCGSWRTCMLRNGSGDGGDAKIGDYEGPSKSTEFGARLGYLDRITTEHFRTDNLRFARVTRLAPDSVVVPHRDYVELSSSFVRIHVPLVTTEQALVSENETIYRMRAGEVWFLDATEVHSIANFSDVGRVHLLLDFAVSDPREVFTVTPDWAPQIPAESLVGRRPLNADETEILLDLDKIIDRTNARDVLAILIKRYFAAELDVLEVFSLLGRIAEGSADADVVEWSRWIHSHSLTAR